MQKLFGEVWVTPDSALIAKLLETGLRPTSYGYTPVHRVVGNPTTQ